MTEPRRVIQLPRIAEITGLPIATHRWMRHANEGPPTFKLGRRVVAYEDQVYAWIEEQRQADQLRRATAS